MECIGKDELGDLSYEIIIYHNGTDAAIPAYARLRFALLGSAFLPKPVGMLLWSALHVVLLVGGPLGIVLAATTCLVLSLVVDFFWVLFLVLGAISLLMWGVIFIFFLIWLCWSLRRESGRLDKIRATCRGLADISCVAPPLFSLTLCCAQRIVYKWSPVWWRVWVGWCEESVHIHDAIVL